jgi:hypothetical protein
LVTDRIDSTPDLLNRMDGWMDGWIDWHDLYYGIHLLLNYTISNYD